MMLKLSLLLALALACFDKDGGDDTASDDDGGGGGDGGTSADGGGGGGDGGGTSGTIDCDDPPAPSSVDGPDCLTGTLACGESLIDTTEGGTDNWDGSAYQGWYCLISTASQYNGPERVYAFDHPGKGNVTFTLTSPCEDLDLVIVRWEDESTCPLPEYSILECEGKDGTGQHSITIWNNEPSRYLVVVDSPGDHETPFKLAANCDG